METLTQLTDLLQQNSGVALASISAAVILLLILLIITWASMRSLRRRYAFLLRNEQTHDLGDIFADHEKRMATIENEQVDHSETLRILESTLKLCIQKVGFLRFDAFEDVGGQQSYTIALLDSDDNGVLVSGLYSRSDSRTYAKAVRKGLCEQNLTGEEQSALEIARQTSTGRAEQLR